MNTPSLFDRVFTEGAFLDSVHGFVKAADISDPTHPWHRIFSKIGDLGRALKGSSRKASPRSSSIKLTAVRKPSPGRSSSGSTMSSRQTLRALKRDVRGVGKARARASREGATLRAMGRAQPGTQSRRPTRNRSRVPGMEIPIR